MQDAVQKHPGDFSSTHRGAQHPWGACPVLRDALPVPVPFWAVLYPQQTIVQGAVRSTSVGNDLGFISLEGLVCVCALLEICACVASWVCSEVQLGLLRGVTRGWHWGGTGTVGGSCWWQLQKGIACNSWARGR